ncbi:MULTISPECIES: 1-phosphofructokinase [Staphylococcaceae]|jgi:1-phosphofructokinase|uniref:1-phosphofructokinase n=1 Tax=Staphylococcaceae TaxID=90964 RepID=UPI001886C756|nr:1-phosphofructokinase [Staphylococcus saprophyticus]MBF2782490.1 1-phosphofructokinase [Staphylococcus saprophyticus]
MIYTCTLNTAIDMFVQMKDFHPNVVNRSIYDEVQPNGKGVNISIMLNKLNKGSVATGFIGGFSGKFIDDELLKLNISTDFVNVDANTRINVFLMSNQGEYKIVNSGPKISCKKSKELLSKIESLSNEDTLFVSGSLPQGLTGEILFEIAKLSYLKKFNLILDISHPVLKNLIPFRPYLIKPNKDELQELFPELDMKCEENIVKAGKLLIQEGCQNVLVSVGSDGAYFINRNESLYCTAPKGKVVNTAGAGDSMLASFYDAYINTKDSEKSLKKAVAVGSSTAFKAGLSDLKDINELMSVVKVSDISVTNKGG